MCTVITACLPLIRVARYLSGCTGRSNYALIIRRLAVQFGTGASALGQEGRNVRRPRTALTLYSQFPQPDATQLFTVELSRVGRCELAIGNSKDKQIALRDRRKDTRPLLYCQCCGRDQRKHMFIHWLVSSDRKWTRSTVHSWTAECNVM